MFYNDRCILSLLKNKIMRKIFKYLGFYDNGKTTVTEKQCNIHNVVRSGDYCECGACGFDGYAYGIAHAKGVSAPFCSNCGINNKLTLKQK